MPRSRIIRRDFREGWLAYEDDVPIWSNPYKYYVGREEVWESGWREAEKWRGGQKKRRAAEQDTIERAFNKLQEGGSARGLKKSHPRWTPRSVVYVIILSLAFAVGFAVALYLWIALSRG